MLTGSSPPHWAALFCCWIKALLGGERAVLCTQELKARWFLSRLFKNTCGTVIACAESPAGERGLTGAGRGPLKPELSRWIFSVSICYGNSQCCSPQRVCTRKWKQVGMGNAKQWQRLKSEFSSSCWAPLSPSCALFLCSISCSRMGKAQVRKWWEQD